MDALEAERVQVAAGVARDERAIHPRTRDRIPAAFGQRLRAVLHALPAAQQVRDERMLLQALERVVGIEERIAVVETSDQAERDASARHRVQERPAELFHAKGI